MSTSTSQKLLSPSIKESSASEHQQRAGYSWYVASFFVVSCTIGSGVVALPLAFSDLGFFLGPVSMTIMCLMLGYTGYVLGENWMKVQRLWPEYADVPCRNPFKEIGKRAMGRIGEIGVHLNLDLTIFGAMTAFINLSSANLSDILSLFGLKVHYCFTTLMLMTVIWPCAMLRSPASFWAAPLIAVGANGLGIILMIVGSSFDFGTCYHESEYKSMSAGPLFASFGTLVYAYSGHLLFPTIQNDMKNTKQFSLAIVVGYSVCLALYIPLGAVGYSIYGQALGDNLIASIQTTWIRQVINIMLTIYLLFTIILLGNPLYQAAEQMFNIQDKFGIGRFVVRSIIFLSACFASISVPSFGLLLGMVGGTTLTMLSIVFPSLFGLYLDAMLDERAIGSSEYDGINQTMPFKEMLRRTPNFKLARELSIIALGIVLGVITTVSGLQAILVGHFKPPCYVELLSDYNTDINNSTVTRCCGAYSNISLIPDFC